MVEYKDIFFSLITWSIIIILLYKWSKNAIYEEYPANLLRFLICVCGIILSGGALLITLIVLYFKI